MNLHRPSPFFLVENYALFRENLRDPSTLFSRASGKDAAGSDRQDEGVCDFWGNFYRF